MGRLKELVHIQGKRENRACGAGFCLCPELDGLYRVILDVDFLNDRTPHPPFIFRVKCLIDFLKVAFQELPKHFREYVNFQKVCHPSLLTLTVRIITTSFLQAKTNS